MCEGNACGGFTDNGPQWLVYLNANIVALSLKGDSFGKLFVLLNRDHEISKDWAPASIYPLGRRVSSKGQVPDASRGNMVNRYLHGRDPYLQDQLKETDDCKNKGYICGYLQGLEMQ